MATAAFGTLPFLISGSINSITEAYFETLSGFTTTGASILTDIESLPRSILLWRSQTQWLGGMGIIVLSIAILPFLGVGGMQLFKAEVPGPTPDRLAPRISQTAGLLWVVYLLLTVSEIFLLRLGGMDLYDAVNHGFTTMATGGFSTHNHSVGHYHNAFIQYVVIFFMFMAGINFSLHYRCLTGLRPAVYAKDREWVFYITILGGASALIFLYNGVSGSGFAEKNFRESLFQVVSITTTTGYTTANFDAQARGDAERTRFFHALYRPVHFLLLYHGIPRAGYNQRHQQRCRHSGQYRPGTGASGAHAQLQHSA